MFTLRYRPAIPKVRYSEGALFRQEMGLGLGLGLGIGLASGLVWYMDAQMAARFRIAGLRNSGPESTLKFCLVSVAVACAAVELFEQSEWWLVCCWCWLILSDRMCIWPVKNPAPANYFREIGPGLTWRSVVVLEESPRPWGSSRTNLQVLVLGSQVYLVFILGPSVLKIWRLSILQTVYN